MPELNHNMDVQFLRGRELIQIAIGLYQVIFVFDDEITISVENHFRYIAFENSVEWLPGAKHIAGKTIELLGGLIEEICSLENGTLEIKFGNGHHLVFNAESTGFESYQITKRGEIIVI